MSDAQKPVAIYRGVVDCGDAGAFDLEMLTMIPRGAKLYTAPTTLTPPDGWAEAVGLAKIMAQLSKPLSERRAEILAQAILDMDAKIKEQK